MKKLLLMILVIVMSMVIFMGCTSEAEDSSDVDESVSGSSEMDSEMFSEDIIENVSENISEETSVEKVEPTIINDVLTFEEAQEYIENLKVLYPDMGEEEIVTLFVNFNIHSLDDETIEYYCSNYDTSLFAIYINNKIYSIILTSENMDGKKFDEYWNLSDFITNSELKQFAVQIEAVMSDLAYEATDDEFSTTTELINEYMYGTNDIGFTFDYNSIQREDTDLDALCYYIAYFNRLYSSDKLGFTDLASQETLYMPIEEYQMEKSQ